MYEQTFLAGWGDMDFNSHMRNTAYLDRSADTRMLYFSENGFPMSEFMRLRLGPVVMKDEIEYYREFHLLESLRVTLSLAGLSEDGSRMILCNDFFKGEKLAARVTSSVGWLDLAGRKLICPPPSLLAALRKLPHSEDFKELKNKSQDT